MRLILCLLLLAFALPGCQSDEERLVGKWQCDDGEYRRTLTLVPKGRGSYHFYLKAKKYRSATSKLKWSLANDDLILEYESGRIDVRDFAWEGSDSFTFGKRTYHAQ